MLSTGELKTLLGGANSQTKLTAVEGAADTNHDFANYECKYGSGGKHPFDLVVTAAKQDLSPQEGVDAIAKGNHVVIHKVTGVGEVGTFFTDSDGESLIAVAKVSHRETRTVIFSAPAVVPEQNFINLAKLVLDPGLMRDGPYGFSKLTQPRRPSVSNTPPRAPAPRPGSTRRD